MKVQEKVVITTNLPKGLQWITISQLSLSLSLNSCITTIEPVLAFWITLILNLKMLSNLKLKQNPPKEDITIGLLVGCFIFFLFNVKFYKQKCLHLPTKIME